MIKVLAAQFAFLAILAGQPGKDDPWAPMKFLVGEWVGEGGGQPGQGTGGFSFQPDLEGNVLVRRSYAEYPATKQRPAYRHDDLMVVFREPGGPELRAVYFDNEGHVIHYTITTSKDGNSIELLSAPSPASPRFRLTYVKTGATSLSTKFEIAPPGKPDSFSTYVEAKARRVTR